jgi:hypothetical protein
LGVPRTVVLASARARTRTVNAETVNLYWFGPSIDDRGITLRPFGVSLCVGLIVLDRLLLQGCPQPLFISVEKAVVQLQS